MRVFYCARTVFVLYSINVSPVYYIKSINKTNFKALFYPDFSPNARIKNRSQTLATPAQ